MKKPGFRKAGFRKPGFVALVSVVAVLVFHAAGRSEDDAVAFEEGGATVAGTADGLESDAGDLAESGSPQQANGPPSVAPLDLEMSLDEGPLATITAEPGVEAAVPPAADGVAGASVVQGEEREGGPPASSPVRYRVKLDVAGELLAPAGRGVPPVRRPIVLDARFDYVERSVPAAADAAVSRCYADAVAEMRIGDEVSRTSLAADARHILVVRQATMARPYLEGAFLTGDEHDLLETPFDSLLLDDMLSSDAVEVGATWEIPADLTAGLLAIDTVESGKLEARLEEVVEGRARVKVAGSVAGGVDGAPTRVEVSGSLSALAREAAESPTDDGPLDAGPEEPEAHPRRYRLQPRVDHLSVVMRERRQAGHVAPGFDVEARLIVARTEPQSGGMPATEPTAHDGHASRRRGDGGPGRVWYRDGEGSFDLVYDSRWRLVEDGPSGLVLRLVDRGALVGQCSIRSTAAAGVPAPTIAAVQQDIEKSLAGEVTRIDDATLEEREDGTLVVRVASSGTAERLPFTWIHYVLVSPQGRRIDVAFMVQESMRSRFVDADRELVASLVTNGGAEAADEAAGSAPVREARATGVSPPSPASPR